MNILPLFQNSSSFHHQTSSFKFRQRKENQRRSTYPSDPSLPRKNRSRSATMARPRRTRDGEKGEEGEGKGSDTAEPDRGAEKERESCMLHRAIRRYDMEGVQWAKVGCSDKGSGEGWEGGWRQRRRDGNRRSALNLARCIARRSRASAAASPSSSRRPTNPPSTAARERSMEARHAAPRLLRPSSSPLDSGAIWFPRVSALNIFGTSFLIFWDEIRDKFDSKSKSTLSSLLYISFLYDKNCIASEMTFEMNNYLFLFQVNFSGIIFKHINVSQKNSNLLFCNNEIKDLSEIFRKSNSHFN